MAWPVEIQVSVIGAVFAVAGYMFKSVIDWWQRKRKERAQTIAELQRLQSLRREPWDKKPKQISPDRDETLFMSLRVSPLCGYLVGRDPSPRLTPWATDLLPLRGCG